MLPCGPIRSLLDPRPEPPVLAGIERADAPGCSSSGCRMSRGSHPLSLARAGFSLLEVLVVLSNHCEPSWASLRSDCKASTGIAKARWRNCEASSNPPGPPRWHGTRTSTSRSRPTNRSIQSRFRRYALFIPDPTQPRTEPNAESVFLRQIVGISEWYRIAGRNPSGLWRGGRCGGPRI